MDLAASRDSFLQYLQYEKRFSNHTLVAYTNDLHQFLEYLLSSYEIKTTAEINHSIVRSWVVSLMEQKVTPRSVNRKISTLKTFYKYLLRQDIVTENPMLKIQSPKTSKRLPVFVEKQNMDTLLDNIEFGDDLEGQRNKLIIELFYATGMRLSELINLKVSTIDLFNCQLKVLGKRNKERIIPFNNQISESLKEYITLKGDLEHDYLFINKKGKKIYEKFAYRVVNNYLSQVTTLDKKSPHVLRHTFATHMLNNGADLNAIKELLGHANLSATQVYTHNTVEKLKNIHKQAHPKA
ncbi:MAG: integrase [Bacteroidetes bacterium RIFCSPLOWO2_12_FULL_35_15]|nr:MAG: integrase [Bacteroidetes bacterium RIFCSPLOWO2_12_FULL_35_15]